MPSESRREEGGFPTLHVAALHSPWAPNPRWRGLGAAGAAGSLRGSPETGVDSASGSGAGGKVRPSRGIARSSEEVLGMDSRIVSHAAQRASRAKNCTCA